MAPITNLARPKIPVMGIVGGVGSGKSAVARGLAQIWPVAIIDADRLGHQVLELPHVREKLRQRFGAGIFDEQGTVIRAKLAALVFGESPEATQARTDLNQITHPEINRLAVSEIEKVRAAQRVKLIVLDAAILLESGWRSVCDLVVFVDVSPERRAEHVQRQRGWTLEEWQRREASQWTIEQKRAAADIVISNNSTLDSAVASLVQQLTPHWAE